MNTRLIPPASVVMPATFDSFGLKFLYPDNWTIADRAEIEGNSGVTFELPCGGFFSIEPLRVGQLTDELIGEVADSIAEEYGEVERDEIATDDRGRTVDLRFYYLDLMVVSRLKFIQIGDRDFFVQMQAESRDFDSNEMVFEAILKQICG